VTVEKTSGTTKV